MVNRWIYHTPFSRKTPTDAGALDQLFSLWDECISSRGILLLQPEHIQSFKLLGLERLSCYDEYTASRLIERSRTMQRESRTVIDESDEVLDVKTQLIYTIGLQQPMDGHSDRWRLTQSLFDLVDRCISRMRTDDNLFDLTRTHPGSFPTINFKLGRFSDTLLEKVVDEIAAGQLEGFHLNYCSTDIYESALNFLKQRAVSEIEATNVMGHFAGDILQKILLLRGLFAHEILPHSILNKRWRVEYGLDPKRCQIAVPYRAKGVPSQSAEFGHPDVAISLTCLSYYYEGLTDEQLTTCFDMLYKSADPSSEYMRWSKACSCMPHALQNLKGVNLDDRDQSRLQLFPHLRFNKAVIDFFLSTLVFPKECKEFAHKLSTSAWDIPAEEECP